MKFRRYWFKCLYSKYPRFDEKSDFASPGQYVDRMLVVSYPLAECGPDNMQSVWNDIEQRAVVCYEGYFLLSINFSHTEIV